MTEKEKAIKEFSKAMRTAVVAYVADGGRMTPGMTMAWNNYVVACMKEASNGRKRHND